MLCVFKIYGFQNGSNTQLLSPTLIRVKCIFMPAFLTQLLWFIRISKWEQHPNFSPTLIRVNCIYTRAFLKTAFMVYTISKWEQHPNIKSELDKCQVNFHICVLSSYHGFQDKRSQRKPKWRKNQGDCELMSSLGVRCL